MNRCPFPPPDGVRPAPVNKRGDASRSPAEPRRRPAGMLQSKTPHMERVARVIGKIRNSQLGPEEFARAAWREAVGKRLAERTGPVWLVRSRLVVEVDDSIWQRNLHVLSGQILAKLEQVLGSGLITDLEFRVRVPRRGPQVEVEQRACAADDAEGILDASLRLVYRNARKKAASA